VVLLEDITERKVLERSKDEFLSIASHELRTPLTAIRGNTAMIKQFYEPQVNDTAFNEMVEDIHQSSVRLISIVNDFLDASRLEQGKIKFKIEPFDLTTVLEGVSYETSNLAQEKDTRIVIDTTLQSIPKVNADKDRVKQIVYNLVGNALRFTEHGSITLTAQKQGDMIKVFVTDTGPGISEEDQRRLFHKFQQAGSNLFTRETSRGTGLGLYISKLLVEGMGGVIGIDHSEIGKGTTFAFTLPIASDTASPSSASQAGEASAA
jgi:signal transduction histidine kinase